MSLINLALSGLSAYQQALATTGHNISNVNTEGYSRQIVGLASQVPGLAGSFYIGKGVQVGEVTRSYDDFLFQQVSSRTTSANEFDTYLKVAGQLDSTLGDADAGLTPALQSFFNSLQDVASNPTSTPARQVLLSQADSIVNRFHALNRQVEDMRDNVNSQLTVAVTQVNSIADALSDINLDIIRATGAASGGLPNDLLDQRNGLIVELSKLTDVSTSLQSDQSMNVYIGTGQALVLGTANNNLTIIKDSFDVTDNQIALVNGSINIPISNQLTGGIIGGLNNVKEEIIDTTQMALGRVAIAFSSNLNTQHQLGDDLTGTAGGLFFDNVLSTAPTALPNANNTGTAAISVSINDVNALEVSDYRLNYDGTNFSVIRLSDDAVVDSGFTTGSFPRTISGEGITLSISGSPSAGDSFLLRPTRNASGLMGVTITSTNAVAAAATGGNVGDNSNALAMVGLQTAKGLANSTSTYQTAFGSIIADVGVKTNKAQVTGDAQTALLNQALEAHSSVSGVNLDEEAANLIKFQQAYQASARVISVADELFQSLLGAVQ